MARGKGKNLGSPVAGPLDEDDLGPGNWTDRQRRFVHRYMQHRNGARAVREAGYSCKPENADRIAWALRNEPRFAHVREAVERLETDLQARLKIEAEQVLEEISKVAFFSLADVVVIQDDGTARLDLTEADAAHLAALSEVQIEERTIKGRDGTPDEVLRTIKIKAHSKLDALEKLGKNLKLFTDKLEMSGGLDIGAQLTAARRRARIAADTIRTDENDGDAAA
ncbi:terminase small subunit [Microvirga sp. RSM25]|uniref:terminase small subunit n=1 Tax=Microvirga sp. RSM25 TaxID=3273802 RepID=UPI00384E5CF0